MFGYITEKLKLVLKAGDWRKLVEKAALRAKIATMARYDLFPSRSITFDKAIERWEKTGEADILRSADLHPYQSEYIEVLYRLQTFQRHGHPVHRVSSFFEQCFILHRAIGGDGAAAREASKIFSDIADAIQG